MKLIVLVDNNSKIDNYLLAEPALCFYIELNNKKILFDCGYSNIFISNAFKLKLDLRDITDIILSHGHNDHTGGLFYLKNLFQDSIELGLSVKTPTITAHSEVFAPKIDAEAGNIGCPLAQNQLEKLFKTNLTNNPVWITPELCFLGEIPRKEIDDFGCLDDSALAYKSPKGLVIITGCSHSGLENILEYAKKVTNTSKIYTVIGGFHLIDKTEQEIKELTSYLKTQNIKTLFPSHCCDLKSKIILSQDFLIEDVCVGNILSI